MGSARPPLSADRVPALVREWYGCDVTVREELEGYDDRNFLVERISMNQSLPQTIKGSVKDPKLFLVKVINKKFSIRPDILAMKNELINHLVSHSFPTPCVLKNLENNLQSVISLTDPVTKEEAKYVLKMLEFLPGIRMDKVHWTRTMCKEQGALTGQMDKIWMSFPVTDPGSVENVKIFWNMSEMSFVRGSFQFVKDQSRVPLLEQVVSEFEAKILASAHSFSKGFIHSDVNDGNTLVEEISDRKEPTDTHCSESSKSYRVNSIIDFGDLTYSYHVYELAIGSAYAVLNVHGVDPMEAVAGFVEGYLEHMRLPAEELQHLRIAMCARLVQSFVYGQVALTEEEDNAYAQTHSSRCWPHIQNLFHITDSQFTEQVGLNTYFESINKS